MFFHKNKRQFRFCTKRTAFCALFLFAILGASDITSLILKANAEPGVIESVEIYSQNSSFANEDSGAWKITKSAKWTGNGKARITFEVDSIPQYANEPNKDIIFIIDDSGSMSGQKLQQVKADSSEIIEYALQNPLNRIALIEFNDNATLLSNFSNDKDALISQVNNLMATGGTSYYNGFLVAENLLKHYEKSTDRGLQILFLTDGYPNSGTPGEIGVFRILKENHPYLTVSGIQYEMGTDILQPIVDVSDFQYIADMTSLNNVLFEATVAKTATYYNPFIITDYIDDRYWSVAGIDSISTSIGNVSLEYEGTTPKITWNAYGLLAGGHATMTIDIDISDNLPANTEWLPTNRHELIHSSANEVPEENVDSPLTPILQHKYRVIYDANLPSGCTMPDNIPANEDHMPFDLVAVSEEIISCPGYVFRGWNSDVDPIYYINDDFFRMPVSDVHVVAAWGQPSISKSTESEIHERSYAYLTNGMDLNGKMKRLSGQTSATYRSYNTYITAIKRAYRLPSGLDTSSEDNIFSSSTSLLPIYGWYSEGTVYYYTEAEELYLDPDSSYLLSNIPNLTDISCLQEWNSSRVTNLEWAFNSNGINDLSPVKKWDTSHVTSLRAAFWGADDLTNLDGLADWDVSNVTDMYGIFYYTPLLNDIDGLKNWNTSKVTNIARLFYNSTSLTNVDALLDWDVSNVTDFSEMFYSNKALTNIDGLRKWNTGKVTTTYYMFRFTDALQNINGALNWDMSNVTSMYGMFDSAKSLTNIDGAANWNTSNVTTTLDMFRDATSLTNINGALNWDMSKVYSMGYMFVNDSNLTDISGARKWNVSNNTNFSYMFDGTAISDIDDLANWNTVKATNMKYMFTNASNLTNIDGALEWNTSNVTDMTNMFKDTSSLTNINGARKWNVAKVTNMSGMFSGATSLANIDGALNWTTNSLTTTSNMFNNTCSLTNIDGALNWNMTKVTTLTYMFAANNCEDTSLTNINGAQNWNTSNVTDTTNMFANSKRLSNLSGAANWNVSNVTNISYMFQNASSITNIDALSGWRPSKASHAYGLFEGATSLENVDGALDWGMGSLVTMQYLFRGATSLSDISGLANWNTAKVTLIAYTFQNTALTNLDALANWNTAKVTSLAYAFQDVPTLTDVSGISGWNTSLVTSINHLFYNDAAITDLTVLNDWNTTKLTNKTDAFYGIPDEIERPSWF